MNALKRALALALPLLACAGSAAATFGVREVPSYQINDVAVASFDAYGPVIYYHPVLMQQIGLAGGFIQAHEHAHHALNHVSAANYAGPWLRQGMELQADCQAASWLARQGRYLEIQAAAQLFATQGGSSDGLHPPGSVRAQEILRCAGL